MYIVVSSMGEHCVASESLEAAEAYKKVLEEGEVSARVWRKRMSSPDLIYFHPGREKHTPRPYYEINYWIEEHETGQ